MYKALEKTIMQIKKILVILCVISAITTLSLPIVGHSAEKNSDHNYSLAVSGADSSSLHTVETLRKNG